jgi:hypothetical protein
VEVDRTVCALIGRHVGGQVLGWVVGIKVLGGGGCESNRWVSGKRSRGLSRWVRRGRGVVLSW